MSDMMTTETPSPGLIEPILRFGMPHRWTNAEFDRLVETGFLREGSGTFLWAGEIVEPMAEDNPHINAVDRLRDLFKARFAAEFWTINQNSPVDLMEGYRPQPDLSLIRGPRSHFRTRKHRPTPTDVALLVEVSDSSYPVDSGELLRIYAKVGIPHYWIVNIPARRVEVYTDPDPEGRRYRSRSDYGLDATIPMILDLEAIAVREVLQDSLDDD